jgi:hypothetical protein
LCFVTAKTQSSIQIVTRQKNATNAPLIILSAPRSGSTLLFETLADAPEFWTVGGESHQFIEGLKPLHPVAGRVGSNRLSERHATPEIVDMLRRRFARFLQDRDGRPFIHHLDIRQLRFLEKTPKNALRQPFLEKVFPGALYVYLYREPRGNISSMMEAWRAGNWVTYPRLPGWYGLPWSLLLPPGWEELNAAPLEEVCAFQWNTSNQIILDDLERLPPERWTACDYQSLIDDAPATVGRLCEFAGVSVDERLAERLANQLPLSRYTQSAPDAEKWRKNEKEILTVLKSVAATQRRCEAVLKKRM